MTCSLCNGRVTASQLDRFRHCPASARLRHVHSTTPGSARGSAAHAYLYLVRAAQVGPDEALLDVPEEHRELCEQIELDRLPSGVAGEVAFAYDVETGGAREIGRGLTREQAYAQLRPTEVGGIADVVGVLSSSQADAVGVYGGGQGARVGYVGDYKTGWSKVPPAAVNLQVKFLALCATLVYVLDGARVELIHIRDDGSVWRDRAEFDDLELAAFGAEVRDIWRQVLGAGPDTPVHEGPWCRFCPAYVHCPAKTALLVQLGRGELEPAGGEPETHLTPENAARAYRLAQRADELVKKLKKQLYAYASQHPIDLGDGLVFGPRQTRGNEILDGDVAWTVLGDLFDTNVADEAMTRAATKKGIERALRTVSSNGELAGNMRRVLAAIREAGGAERPVKTTIEEYARDE